jgi:hypothetical protein
MFFLLVLRCYTTSQKVFLCAWQDLRSACLRLFAVVCVSMDVFLNLRRYQLQYLSRLVKTEDNF